MGDRPTPHRPKSFLKSRREGASEQRMTIRSDDRSQAAAASRARGPLRLALAAVAAVLAVIVAGFAGFLFNLRSTELQPARKADGIVVLTGGSSRVSDALELLAAGYGKRLLISGVHPTIAAADISRSVQEGQGLFHCCVDLDHSAVNTRSNALETERWARQRGFKSLVVVTSNYHMPRAIVEMSHAMPDMTLVPFAVVGDKWRDEPWWSSGATFRLVLSEYVKYIAAMMRVRLEAFGVDPTLFEPADQPTGSVPMRRPATAQAN